MKIFIQEHLKAIIIGLVAVICVAGAGIGILLYNSGKADEPEVQEEASVATDTDSALVGEVIEDKDEILEADSEKVSDKKKEDKEKTQDVKKESSKDKDSSKESKTTDSDKKTTTKTTEAATSKTSTDNTTKTTESTKKNSDSSSGSGSSSSSSSSSASSNSGSKSSESGSGSKSSDSGSGNSGSSSGSSESTTCSHTWVWATKTVHHDAVTKQEPYYGEEWDEPVYRDAIQCLVCGNIYNSRDEYFAAEPTHGNWTTIQVVDHYEHHDPDILGYDTVVVKEAYDETVNDYQYCSKCGARK